jgi:hypothetical protein
MKNKLSKIRATKPGFDPLYTRRDKFIYPSDEEYAEKLRVYIPESEEKLDRNATLQKLKHIEYLFNKNKCSKKIFNRLISDVRCLDKIVFVNDGSYCAHKIYVTVDDVRIEMCEYKTEYPFIRSGYSTKSHDKKIVLKKFERIISSSEKIFIQINLKKSFNFIEPIKYRGERM